MPCIATVYKQHIIAVFLCTIFTAMARLAISETRFIIFPHVASSALSRLCQKQLAKLISRQHLVAFAAVITVFVCQIAREVRRLVLKDTEWISCGAVLIYQWLRRLLSLLITISESSYQICSHSPLHVTLSSAIHWSLVCKEHMVFKTVVADD